MLISKNEEENEREGEEVCMFDESGVGFKNRVMVVAFLLTSVFIFIFVALIYTEQENNFENAKTAFQKTLHLSIDQTINATIDTYSLMAGTVLNTTKAKELMKEGRREDLYKLLESKWKMWSAINPEFNIMLFHKADGTAFLRMHKPEVYNDYLSEIRPMVKAAHEQKRVLTGYETGKYSTVFRLMTPILYKNEYLGTLDFGINPNYFIKEIDEFTGHQGVLFVKEENLRLFKRDSALSINGYVLQSRINEDVDKLLKSLPVSYAFNECEILEVEGKYYLVYAYSMNDFKNEKKAQLLFFYDITQTVELQNEFTIILALTSVLFIVLMYFLLNKSLNRLLVSLRKMHKKHTTELEEAQRLTEFNEKYLTTVLDASQSLIFTTVGLETLSSANKAFLNFTGCERLDAFLMKYECVSDVFEEVDDQDYLGQDKDGIHWIEYIYKHSSRTLKVKILQEGKGHTFLVKANKMVLDEKDRNVFVFTDITELLDYQERIQEKDAMLYRQSRMAAMGEMISMIAHQWRQPLGTVSAATNGLILQIELGALETKELRNTLDNINDYVQYMSKTIDDFRNFYKPDKKKESVYLKDIIESALSLSKPFLHNNNIKVVCDCEEVQPVVTYSNELIQVVLNLIKNAQDILTQNQTPQAKITLSTRQSAQDEQSIVVADNDGGVPEELIEKIFEPYFTTKGNLNGTGLGLYMSKTIVEEHCGGRISVENDNGAHFIITLPMTLDKGA